MSLTRTFAPITKSEKLPDGSMLVYGQMTGPQLDLDGQVCDPAWLKSAVPEWFKIGNVREMHQAWAVGKGVEVEQAGDDHWLTAKIVDADAIVKVDEGVYTGFSIGIKSPKIVKDAGAPNGRIIGGTIIETSLVDRPCNESAKLVLAKMAKGGEWTASDALVKDAGTVEAVDEVAEESLVAQAVAALNALLQQEVDEYLEGDGGRGPVRRVLSLLEDLEWYVEVDTWDDAQFMGALKIAIAGDAAEPQEELVKLSTIADLVKAATADDADLVEVRKALGIDELTTKVDELVAKSDQEPTTKVATAEELEELADRLTKVEGMAAPGGPHRATHSGGSPVDARKAALTADVAKFTDIANTTNDPDMRRGYTELANNARTELAAL